MIEEIQIRGFTEYRSPPATMSLPRWGKLPNRATEFYYTLTKAGKERSALTVSRTVITAGTPSFRLVFGNLLKNG